MAEALRRRLLPSLATKHKRLCPHLSSEQKATHQYSQEKDCCRYRRNRAVRGAGASSDTAQWRRRYPQEFLQAMQESPFRSISQATSMSPCRRLRHKEGNVAVHLFLPFPLPPSALPESPAIRFRQRSQEASTHTHRGHSI